MNHQGMVSPLCYLAYGILCLASNLRMQSVQQTPDKCLEGKPKVLQLLARSSVRVGNRCSLQLTKRFFLGYTYHRGKDLAEQYLHRSNDLLYSLCIFLYRFYQSMYLLGIFLALLNLQLRRIGQLGMEHIYPFHRWD